MRKLHIHAGRFRIQTWTSLLALWNRIARRSILDPRCGLNVSLTTYGRRTDTVYLAIESIGLGRRRPRRLILWIDEPDTLAHPPATLRRLMRRGLEIRPCENFGPHKKWWPYCNELRNDGTSLVTADDDVLYPWLWLWRLARGNEQHPEDVLCLRAHKVVWRADETVAPYRDWQYQRGVEAHRDVFPTGVAGVLYPAKAVELLRLSGDAWKDLCPRADDVWLHFLLAYRGILARQLVDSPKNLSVMPDTQAEALALVNEAGAANDIAIKRTVDYISAMRASADC